MTTSPPAAPPSAATEAPDRPRPLSGLVRAARAPSLRLIGRRLATAIPVMWGVTFITFTVMNVMPGNAAQQLLGVNATPEQVRQLARQLGLDRPFLVRYGDWLGGVVTGDLGNSLASGQSVASILAQRLPVTAELVLYALILSLAFTVPVALLAARRPGGIADRISMALSMVGLSTANYVLALVLVIVFAVYLPIMPAIGFVPPSEGLGRNIQSLTLPAVAMAFPLFCFYTRLLRGDILEQMQGQDYVMTAKAKGVGPWRVLTRHALRNSLFGLLTIVGLNLGTLIGATVIIEQIFALPGIGQEMLQAVNNRDVIVVEAVVMVFAVIVVLANLLVDVLYAVLDPRIRYGQHST